MPSSFPPTQQVKPTSSTYAKCCVIVVSILHILIPDKKWMGKHLLWSLNIIQDCIWKVWQNFGVLGVHQPLHIPHLVLWKPICLAPNPWQTLAAQDAPNPNTGMFVHPNISKSLYWDVSSAIGNSTLGTLFAISGPAAPIVLPIFMTFVLAKWVYDVYM